MTFCNIATTLVRSHLSTHSHPADVAECAIKRSASSIVEVSLANSILPDLQLRMVGFADGVGGVLITFGALAIAYSRLRREAEEAKTDIMVMLRRQTVDPMIWNDEPESRMET